MDKVKKRKVPKSRKRKENDCYSEVKQVTHLINYLLGQNTAMKAFFFPDACRVGVSQRRQCTRFMRYRKKNDILPFFYHLLSIHYRSECVPCSVPFAPFFRRFFFFIDFQSTGFAISFQFTTKRNPVRGPDVPGEKVWDWRKAPNMFEWEAENKKKLRKKRKKRTGKIDNKGRCFISRKTSNFLGGFFSLTRRISHVSLGFTAFSIIY